MKEDGRDERSPGHSWRVRRTRAICPSCGQRFAGERVPPPRGESFVTVQRFPSSRPEPGEPQLAPFFLDFDGDLDRVIAEVLLLLGCLGDFQDLPVEAARLYYTGNKGIHVEVVETALGVEEASADLAYAYGRWARDLAGRLKLSTVDLGVYSARRMWRQVGSRQSRTGLYKVEVAPANLLRGPGHLRGIARKPRPALPYPEPAVSPVAAETLRGYLKAYQAGRAAAAQGAASTCCADVPPCIERLRQGYWRGTGKSNRALMLLASWMYAAGVVEEAAVAQAGRWLAGAPAALFASPPRDRLREAEKVVRSSATCTGAGATALPAALPGRWPCVGKLEFRAGPVPRASRGRFTGASPVWYNGVGRSFQKGESTPWDPSTTLASSSTRGKGNSWPRSRR